jgi:6-pyruvoyl-tetrahydropterin synthase
MVTSKVIDFNEIIKVIDRFDHCLLIPKHDEKKWRKLKPMLPCEVELVTIPNSLTVVEYIAREIEKLLLEISGVEKVSFELYESEKQGVGM